MSYKLYNRTGSGGFVVEAALALADQPYQLVTMETKPGTPLPESFREINRKRRFHPTYRRVARRGVMPSYER